MALTLTGIKDRLLITDGSFDSALQLSIDEATRYVTTVSIAYGAVSTISDTTTLGDIVSDLGAGIFQRRHHPTDMDTGWWGNGLKKLKDHIFAVYDSVNDAMIDAQIAILDAQVLNVPKEGAILSAEVLNIPKQGELLDEQVSKGVLDNVLLQHEADAAGLTLQDGEVHFVE